MQLEEIEVCGGDEKDPFAGMILITGFILPYILLCI